MLFESIKRTTWIDNTDINSTNWSFWTCVNIGLTSVDTCLTKFKPTDEIKLTSYFDLIGVGTNIIPIENKSYILH
jgi:hypothetical protein